MIEITAQNWVHELIRVTELRENWPVPADQAHSIAYLVDLSENGIDYRNEDGSPMSMSAIIKNAVGLLIYCLFLYQ